MVGVQEAQDLTKSFSVIVIVRGSPHF